VSQFMRLCAILSFVLISSEVWGGESGQPAAEAPAVATDAPLHRAVDSYYSPNLRANLFAEWMYIIDRYGRQHTFWGVRIVGMDPDSPLKGLPGVRLGDVVTRLDGIPIARGMYRRGGNRYFEVPQAEGHYARTEVRWIRSGTHEVLIDRIFIDRGQPNGTGGPNDPVTP